MKRDILQSMRLKNVNVDSMQVFVTTNKDGTKINADVKAKN